MFVKELCFNPKWVQSSSTPSSCRWGNLAQRIKAFATNIIQQRAVQWVKNQASGVWIPVSSAAQNYLKYPRRHSGPRGDCPHPSLFRHIPAFMQISTVSVYECAYMCMYICKSVFAGNNVCVCVHELVHMHECMCVLGWERKIIRDSLFHVKPKPLAFENSWGRSREGQETGYVGFLDPDSLDVKVPFRPSLL